VADFHNSLNVTFYWKPGINRSVNPAGMCRILCVYVRTTPHTSVIKN